MSSIIKFLKEKKGKRELRLNIKKVLVLGGYGYKNVGDEAQLNCVIKRLQKCFPNYQIRVLSPNIEYTKEEHEFYNVGEAPRIAFFKQGESIIYSISSENKGFIYNILNRALKLLFLFKSYYLLMNAYLVKHDKPCFLISANAASLLYEIRTSSVVYFDGGGYLTGSTLSRLWDGILVCRIAKVFDVPVVMSGQTIGVWQTSFNKRYAKKGLDGIKLVSLRDINESVNDIREADIKIEKMYPVCDDALFCEKETRNEIIEKVYKDSECDDSFLDKGFVAFNIHYWGINSELDKENVLEKIYKIISFIRKKSELGILFIPMVPEDEIAMYDYLNRYSDEHVKILKYSYDFRIVRRVIADSRICITMKHHPIIFSIGECRPVIALNRGQYYIHKNNGALEILGVAEYSINLMENDYLDKCNNLFCQIYNEYDELSHRIMMNLKILEQKVNIFEENLKVVVEKHEERWEK